MLNQLPRHLFLLVYSCACGLLVSACDGGPVSGPDYYQEQKALLDEKLLSDSIAGFKAGLTSPAAQSAFNTDGPLAGVLLASGSIPLESAFVHSSDFGQLMVEVEIGFIVAQPITARVGDVEELRKMISASAPAVELPDLAVTGGDTSVPSLVRTNLSSHSFIIGASRGAQEDVDAVTVRLYRDNEEITSGIGSDAMGSQWEALLWLVNRTIESGWTIRPGQVLITGALGAMVEGVPGRYRADFGEFGEINFSIL